ncbi:MAG TPA: acylneuraminate cytidylyltransferase family protein [Chitinophagaceae bacterium]|nr:acylneuraminate cytidylyltransferase family protein [Chitinophagaceae bacterium]
MFILGTICCRGGSKGVKNKNTRLLNGKPLINYTIEAATASNFLNDVIVSTDSDDIAATAKLAGIKTIINRPAELATDAASKWPVFIHALESYERMTGITVDYLVDMDVTVPLKKTLDIDEAIAKALEDTEAEVIITGYEPERNPYFNMMELGPGGFARMVKQSPTPIVRRQDAPLVFSLTPAAYVIKKDALYSVEHWSEAKCKIHPIPRKRAIDIDTETDFKLVEFFLNNGNDNIGHI